MLKKLLIGCLILNICFLSFVSCNSNDKEAIIDSNSLKVIEVASVTPLSGELKESGISLKNGAQLSVANKVDLFKKLGYDLKFLPFDDQANPNVGVKQAKKIIKNENILAVMGHYNSGVSIKTSLVYNKKKLAMVSPTSTSVELTEGGLQNVNRIVARDDIQGSVAANYAIKDLKTKIAYVIHDGTTYGKGLVEEFKKDYIKAGGKVSNASIIKSGQKDFSKELNAAKTDKAELIYFGGLYPEGMEIIKQMLSLGVNAKFIGPDGVDNPKVVENVQKAVLGTYYTTTACNISNTNIGKVWLAKYTNRFNATPESYTIYGYDAMDIILNAILKLLNKDSSRVPTREDVAKAIRKTRNFEGLSTSVTLNNKGDNESAQVFVYRYDEMKYPANLISKINISSIK